MRRFICDVKLEGFIFDFSLALLECKQGEEELQFEF